MKKLTSTSKNTPIQKSFFWAKTEKMDKYIKQEFLQIVIQSPNTHFF